MISNNPYLVKVESLEFKKFDTPEELVAWEYEMTWDKFKDSEIHLTKDIVITPAEFVENIRRQGIWGYASDKNVVYYWTDGKQSMEMLIHFFAHEIGHRTGKQQRGVFMEECRADSYAEVAELAYKIAVKEFLPV